MSEDDIRLCPTCGALPCDWTTNPFEVATLSPAEGALRAEAFPRLQALVDSDHDHMIARTAEDMEWLIEQLLMYPERVHPERTTNHRFLRYSMAATLLSALTPTETGEQGK